MITPSFCIVAESGRRYAVSDLGHLTHGANTNAGNKMPPYEDYRNKVLSPGRMFKMRPYGL